MLLSENTRDISLAKAKEFFKNAKVDIIDDNLEMSPANASQYKVGIGPNGGCLIGARLKVGNNIFNAMAHIENDVLKIDLTRYKKTNSNTEIYIYYKKLAVQISENIFNDSAASDQFFSCLKVILDTQCNIEEALDDEFHKQFYIIDRDFGDFYDNNDNEVSEDAIKKYTKLLYLQNDTINKMTLLTI